jgi:cell shape-determining protein MreC
MMMIFLRKNKKSADVFRGILSHGRDERRQSSMARAARRSRPKILNRKSAVALGVFMVFVVTLNFTRPAYLGGFFATLGKPIWFSEKVGANVLGQFRTYFRSKSSLKKENDDLREEIRAVYVVEAKGAVLEAENRELRAALGRPIHKEYILGDILSRPDATFYDTFVINVGRREGVVVGKLVLDREGLAVGYIERVDGYSSVVRLYSTPDEKLNVLVTTKDIPAIAIGRGGGNFAIELPRDLEVSVGSPITIPGAEHVVLGVVEYVELDQTNSLQTILFRQPINIYTQKWILIEK